MWWIYACFQVDRRHAAFVFVEVGPLDTWENCTVGTAAVVLFGIVVFSSFFSLDKHQHGNGFVGQENLIHEREVAWQSTCLRDVWILNLSCGNRCIVYHLVIRGPGNQ